MSRLHSSENIPVALFLGGLDPSAGAGIFRDLTVASGLGVFSMAIPLAETIQNGFECKKIVRPSINPVERLKFLEPHLHGEWGVKLSMFHDCSLLQDVLPMIDMLTPSCAIWDPIFAPTHGTNLHEVSAFKKNIGLFSATHWVVSPNIIEARLLADLTDVPLEKVAEKIIDMGAPSVWVRGGHASGEKVQDLWCDKNGSTWLTPYDRLAGDPRGTGCTITAAWLAYRMCGMEPVSAIDAAIQYTRTAWKYLHTPGSAGRLTFPPKVSEND